jgi:molybdate transport system substrate-binding protein
MFRCRGIAAIAAVLLATFTTVAARAADLPEIKVFGAASVAESIDELGVLFANQGQGKVVGSYASSSTLAKQIENGAPANVFISADEQWADYLDQRKLLEPNTRFTLLGNGLVLIAPSDSPVTMEIKPGFALVAALKDGRLAVGDPDHVPAGIYAKAALEKLGVWSGVEPKLARGDSVHAALIYVERGESPLGIVYSTDAAASTKVRVVAEFPEDSHPPIVYPAALVAGQATPAAHAFIDFLKTPAAKAVFRKHGFRVD